MRSNNIEVGCGFAKFLTISMFSLFIISIIFFTIWLIQILFPQEIPLKDGYYQSIEFNKNNKTLGMIRKDGCEEIYDVTYDDDGWFFLAEKKKLICPRRKLLHFGVPSHGKGAVKE